MDHGKYRLTRSRQASKPAFMRLCRSLAKTPGRYACLLCLRADAAPTLNRRSGLAFISFRWERTRRPRDASGPCRRGGSCGRLAPPSSLFKAWSGPRWLVGRTSPFAGCAY